MHFEEPWPEDERGHWNDGEQEPMDFQFYQRRSNPYTQAYGNYAGGYSNVGMRRDRPQPYGPPRGPPMFGPPLPPPPPLMGQGFGPGGPRMPPKPQKPPTPQQRTVNYLIRCGMAKDNLKNLPRALIDLIKPENCGICGMAFETFALSRVHYGSKNHLKSHKKWLSQSGQGGNPRGSKEIPIKSRELYCELCDVHITSKVHADSHYSGKQHRAVVEGRKLPKNPFLLQPEMRARLELLIRREKKHLKPTEVVVVTEEMKKEAKKPKLAPPELYCECCKTSVTNTEQMTMHLNGKRHLAKEKQHILSMMRGDQKKENVSGDSQEEDSDSEETTQIQTTKVTKRNTVLKPWITNNLLKCFKRRDWMHKQQKKNLENSDIEKSYKTYRNMCGEATKIAKALYFGNQITRNVNDLSLCWDLLNEYVSKLSVETDKNQLNDILAKLERDYPKEEDVVKFNEFFEETINFNEWKPTNGSLYIFSVDLEFKNTLSCLKTSLGSFLGVDDKTNITDLTGDDQQDESAQESQQESQDDGDGTTQDNGEGKAEDGGDVPVTGEADEAGDDWNGGGEACVGPVSKVAYSLHELSKYDNTNNVFLSVHYWDKQNIVKGKCFVSGIK